MTSSVPAFDDPAALAALLKKWSAPEDLHEVLTQKGFKTIASVAFAIPADGSPDDFLRVLWPAPDPSDTTALVTPSASFARRLLVQSRALIHPSGPAPEALSAEKSVWAAIAGLMRDEKWSLSDALHEVSVTRHMLPTLLCARPRTMTAPPFRDTPGRGSGSAGSSDRPEPHVERPPKKPRKDTPTGGRPKATPKGAATAPGKKPVSDLWDSSWANEDESGREICKRFVPAAPTAANAFVPRLSAPESVPDDELSRSDVLHSFTRELLSLVLLQGGIVVLENPTSSLLWLTSECQHWIRHHALSATQIAACVHGLSAAKSWTFVSNLSDLSNLAALCPHRPGFHPALSGRRDSSGQFLTRHTACYPASLCADLASILAPFLSSDNRVVPFLDWESCLLPPRSSWPVPPSRVEDGAGAVSTASWAVPSGPNCFAALRKSWTSRILSGDFLAKFRANIASGAKHPPISDSDLEPFLSDLRSCLSVPEAEFQQLLHVPAGQPFRLFLLKALLSVANDPDTAFIDLLVSGVPLGVDEPMPPCPSLFPAPPASEPDMDLSHCESSWGSALSDPATVDRLLQAEVSEGWIAEVPGGLPALKRQYDRSAVGKLGLVKAPDRDPRLVVDGSVSGVTAHTHLPNKSANPTITGLRRCLPCRTSLERLFALILDVSKAHRRILIRPADRGLLCFFHRRRLYQCLTLNFGARASGYYWARVAGLLSRLLHRLLFVRHALLIYVDDLISLFSGPSAPVWASIMCVLLLLLRVPMSWHKAYLGCRPSWIGWSMDFDSMSATLEAPKLARLRDLLGLVLRSDSVPLHLLRKLTGKLLWVCSLFRPFRPSLGPLYRDQGLPPLVHVAVSPDLWSSFRSALTPDLRLQREDLDFRPYAPGQRSQAVVRISRAFADACADCRSAGIGGFVRLVSGRCVWFRHNFSASDLASLFPWFDGHSSPQKFIAAWELLGQLALVWCIALLVPAGHPPIHFVSRCDNAPSDSASWKGISTARGLCSMLRTYFAWQRHFCVSTYIDHVPGFRNKVADGLSRSASPSGLGLSASDEVVIPWDLLSCPPRPQYHPTAAWSAFVFPAAGQYEQAMSIEEKRVAKMKICVQCDERDAVLFCDQCKDFFCQGCFDRLHSRGRRQNHRRTWVEMGMCAECVESIALFHCVQCADLCCRDCFQEWHVRGGRRNHIPIILRSFNSQTHQLPEATPAMGTGAAQILAKARSPWVEFIDENNVKLYYNILTTESRRDKPLAVINEPIEDNKGGGMSAGWSGTWGQHPSGCGWLLEFPVPASAEGAAGLHCLLKFCFTPRGPCSGPVQCDAMNNIPALLNHLDANRESPTLSLAYASISDEGIVEVSKFLRDNPFVKYLDLRGNNIQAKGAMALANGIKINRSLRSLNLKWNAIGKDPSGLNALCDVLKSNLTVGHVDLRNNRVNNVGAKYIGEMLASNTTITHLDLSWNDLGADGGLALLEGLKHNSTVLDCQLSGSKVGEETLHEVAFLLRRNKASAAYKASSNSTGAQMAAADSKTATFGKPVAPGRGQVDRSQAETKAPEAEALPPAKKGPQAKANWTPKDSSTLMLRLMMKEREQVLPEDKVFYQQIAEHIDKLLLETSKHKQGRVDGEEREKLSTTGFLEREQRYIKEIRQTEEALQRVISEKEFSQKELAAKSMSLNQLNEQNTSAVRESIVMQERTAAEEQQLRKELRELQVEKKDLQDKLALNVKDLELLEQDLAVERQCDIV
ncbi:LRRC45 [Symbiodinium sp. KB8]|nr:LRRC45 [Symbiodinium sp. KB8]